MIRARLITNVVESLRRYHDSSKGAAGTFCAFRTVRRYYVEGRRRKVAFPKHIEINRPHDEYAIVLNIQKMDINKGVSDDKFVLTQPEGSQLQRVGEATRPGSHPKDVSRK